MSAAPAQTALLDLSPRPARVLPFPTPRPKTSRHAPLHSSASPEWYTPAHVIALTLAVLGAIDLDPCSNSHEHPNVPAARHYTKDDNGLIQPWQGRLFVNPPYGRGIDPWIEKLVASYEQRQITAAIALVPSRTDAAWFARMDAYPRCFARKRLVFVGAKESAPFPSAIFYLGADLDRFVYMFKRLGRVWGAPLDRTPTPLQYRMEIL